MATFGSIDQFADPGMGTPTVSSEAAILWGVISMNQLVGVQLKSTTVDARQSPTTTLQRGLALGRVTASGLYKEYDATATDGSEICRGFLYQDVQMLDGSGSAAQKQGRMVWWGSLKASQLGGLDAAARRQVANRIWFDDLQTTAAPAVVDVSMSQAKTADYTVLASDSGKMFTTLGASGAVNFTLPTLAAGLEYTFFNAADQDMTVTSAAGDDMVVPNDLAADSVAFSTAGDKIGGCVKVFSVATKWYVMKLCSNAMTIVT